MSFLLLCLGLTVLVPSLAHAQPTGVLGIPGNGSTVSGVGMISGWKCEAEGDITIRLNDGDPMPATYGLPRADTSGVCGNDGNNGFFSYTNWGRLGDGTHTAVREKRAAAPSLLSLRPPAWVRSAPALLLLLRLRAGGV